jgi:aminomethyltransferase
MKHTPLHSRHLALNARMAEFAGYDMPIQYTGIVEEHLAVRNQAGLFDVSHMGNFDIKGPGAAEFLDSMLTGNVGALPSGKVLYTVLCTPDGAAVDDLFVSKVAGGFYQMVVNASNIEKDFQWLRSHAPAAVELVNRSETTAILALQGPQAMAILDSVARPACGDMESFTLRQVEINGVKFWLSRTGYTGEDGVEMYPAAEKAGMIWDVLMERGKDKGLRPAGLGCRDTLRLEMGYSLYGHEINDKTNVLEAGLGWVVDLNKAFFIGRDALVQSKAAGLKRKLAGLLMQEKAIPRAGFKIVVNGQPAGEVTSGTQSPGLGKGIALGYVPVSVKMGDTVQVDIRGRLANAQVVKRKFLG